MLLRWLLLTFSLCKTPLGETGCLDNPWLLLTGCLSIQLFDSSVTQSVRLPMATYLSLCSTCVTYRTSCHAIGCQVLPTQPLPREAEDFPRGERYFKHVPPLTYLIYLSPKELYLEVVFKVYGLSAFTKRRMLAGSIYVPKVSFTVRVQQPWNLPLIGVEPVFSKVAWVNSRLSWRLGHE